ncbi:MAG: multidrug ABC transporter ATP-binding protein [Deltaproteobacteria bacterium RIFOXYD12_FULL_57_12]|nr:MAG: multidrug ABC transporter ATP-binding protein [Deltaproteobacteria bacterium RIFOXYD12_FULL_57_12]
MAVSLLRPFFRRYRGMLLAGFLALLTVDFLQLWIPRIIKQAVDELQRGAASQAGILRHGLSMVLLALAIAFFRFGWRYLILGFSRLLERDLRDQLFAHLLTLDRFFFQRRTSGEIMALSSNDLAAVQLACGMGLVAFVDAVVMSTAALAFMAYIHPGLTLIAVVPMPFLALLTRFLSGRLHHRFRKVQEQFSLLTEFARNSLSAIRLLKAYSQEQSQVHRFDRLGRAYIRDNLRLALVQGTLFPVSGLVANISLLLVILFGGRLTVQGRITVGDFVAFISYLFMLTWPMMAFGWVANLFQRGVTSLCRINEILQERPVLQDVVAGLEVLPVARGEFAIKGLTFAFAGLGRPVLHDINLAIGPGVTGIVGATGSGKTTLCHLLARLYPVPAGCLFLDGRDMNELPLAAVRGSISYVPQDIVLFSDTVAANIAMGRPDATRQQIEAAARTAAIHEEILAMEHGYETRVGERGVMISGGQRQRLALARALLLDRPILIIDDGLSAVDTETEHAIILAIAGYLRGRTCIIVSHRIAPLVDADTILVMDQGRIAAAGTHAQLVRTSDFYATIYRHQLSPLAGAVGG